MTNIICERVDPPILVSEDIKPWSKSGRKIFQIRLPPHLATILKHPHCRRVKAVFVLPKIDKQFDLTVINRYEATTTSVQNPEDKIKVCYLNVDKSIVQQLAKAANVSFEDVEKSGLRVAFQIVEICNDRAAVEKTAESK